MINTLFGFLSDNSTFIVAWIVFFSLGLSAVVLLARWQSAQKPSWKKTVNSSLGLVFLLGEFFGLGILFSLVITNCSLMLHEKPLDFSARITAKTDWVKEELTIYFFTGKKFFSVQPDGENLKLIYESQDPIREYHISPDGKSILIVTTKSIVLFHPISMSIKLLEGIHFAPENQQRMQGALDGIRWDPMSQRFCYRLSTWSRYSSSDSWYVYEIAGETKKAINSQGVKFADLKWNEQGQSLYSVRFTTMDKIKYGSAFEIKVYKIPLGSLTPELVLQLPNNEKSLSDAVLKEHGIVLDKKAEALSFVAGMYEGKDWVSPQGFVIGIDEFDQLYYVRNAWFKRRLYTIPREDSPIPQSKTPASSFKYAVEELKWLPSGKYVIMAHSYLGVLILDPVSGKIGILTSERGKGFGWYQPGK